MAFNLLTTTELESVLPENTCKVPREYVFISFYRLCSIELLLTSKKKRLFTFTLKTYLISKRSFIEDLRLTNQLIMCLSNLLI